MHRRPAAFDAGPRAPVVGAPVLECGHTRKRHATTEPPAHHRRSTGCETHPACAPPSYRVSISDLWYKDAIVYSLSVGTFMDSNGDGYGDFPGLMRRLDYLQGLGVTTIWLMPFAPSPFRDDGYDVADYYGVDPRYGTLGDFVEFTQGCHQRGIRVLIDLVVNHTSNEHP
jgi:1,4-alpha-glucan branching enzyme